jgi:cob(I)alamin adenosyltransferase
MSITTKRGDAGTTDLLYGRRVPKTDVRMAALGSIDELTAVFGLARTQGVTARTGAIIARVQRELIGVMGLLAVHSEDANRYAKDGFAGLEESHLQQMTAEALEMERELPPLKDWVIPGSRGSQVAALLDMARAVARRAERHAWEVYQHDALPNEFLLPYLNRLSDLCWILARIEEAATESARGI